MAKRSGGFWRNLLSGHPVKAVTSLLESTPEQERERERQYPPQEPEPPREPEPTERGAPPIWERFRTPSERVYNVILAGYGLVQFRPDTADDATCRDYVINMQGYIRGGSRNRSQGEYVAGLRRLEDVTVSGHIVDHGNEDVEDIPFETSLVEIDYLANAGEPLTGAGWKSE